MILPMKTSPSQPVLIFLHLPKTAGSTLLRIIEQQYNSDAVLELYTSSFGEELKSIPRGQLAEKRLITGHFYFGVHTHIPGPATYITLLRDPIDRIISHYYFVQRNPTHYLYASTREMNLQEYVKFCDRAEPNNDQTRLLAGIDYASNSGNCSPEMLPVAKQNLREHFTVAGITEEFDRSMLLMKRIFGWKTPFYVKQNVTRQRPSKEQISKETLRVIQEFNDLDIELYHHGKALFQQQLHAQKSAVEKELRLFSVLNISYNKVHRLVSSTAGKLGLTQA